MTTFAAEGAGVAPAPAQGASERPGGESSAVRRLLYVAGCVLLDTVAMTCAFGCALVARVAMAQVLVLSPTLGFIASRQATMMYAITAVITLGGLAYEGMYQTGLAMLDQTERQVKSLFWSLVLMMIVSFGAQAGVNISRLLIFLFYLFTMLAMVLWRPLWERRIAGWLQIHPTVMLLDNASIPRETYEALMRMGFNVQPSPRAGVGATEAAAFVRDDSDLAANSLAKLEAGYQEIAVLPSPGRVTALGSRAVNLYGAQVFVISHPLLRRFNRFLKRVVDILAASVLLLFGLLPGLVVAMLVKADSPGPIFYGQRRLGRDGQTFTIWKFRTMVSNAEQHLMAVLAADPRLAEEYRTTYKLKDDPRITRLGKWLRRYSLDELPQFWNVLEGSMSLIGPRAIVESERALFGPAYEIIATVRPGVTGIWQTSGRSDTSYQARCNFDVYYVRCWSPWLDFALLMKTIQAVFAPGAY